MKGYAFYRAVEGFFVVIVLAGCGGSSSATSTSASQLGEARFTLSGAGHQETIQYKEADGNLIFCRPSGTLLWVRLAEQTVDNGDHGRHIDIDVCNYTSTVGDGRFTAIDPSQRPCPQAPTWDIFWHEGMSAFANLATSSPCELKLTRTGTILDGVFSCSGLVEIQGGVRTGLEVLDGTFRCTVSPEGK